ncbi:MAG TPA: uroporphyrinogen decarboxylase [Actinomycetota bacterium]|nr:uroporphyrinogen decarboxylase [Actinomycetota bacterium]
MEYVGKTVDPSSKKERFLRACRREPVDVTPIWMMRQAGRSLPAYRRLRERFSFKEIATDAALTAEVTLMPMDALDVDAAIIFADIMTPMAALGVEYDIIEGQGPLIKRPIRSMSELESLDPIPVSEAVPELFEAIGIVRKELDGVAPVIGFAGAPFTLASYLIEGRANKEFHHTKRLMHHDAETWHALLDRLAGTIAEYLRTQVQAGIQAFQLFDSWVGQLSPMEYQRYALPHTSRVFRETADLGVDRIHFGTGIKPLLELMALPDPEVIGIDWTVPLDLAWERIGSRAIQGNLDPRTLLGPRHEMIRQAENVLKLASGRPGHIFNLGHGVLPDTPLGNLKALVETVHSFSP